MVPPTPKQVNRPIISRRRARLNRDGDGNVLGITIVLGARDLAALRVDADTQGDAVEYTIADGRLCLAGQAFAVDGSDEW